MTGREFFVRLSVIIPMMMAASITTAMNVDAPMVKALNVSMCGMVCLFYWLTNEGKCLL
jgi:hypothetical protein